MPDDREELAALIASWDRGFPALDAADEILARWRLVPVEERCEARSHVGDRCRRTDTHDDASHRAKSGYTWQGTYGPRTEQHRAADELTHHDQEAGIYGDQPMTGVADADVFCPFSGTGECPSDCPTNRDRACVNGEPDDE